MYVCMHACMYVWIRGFPKIGVPLGAPVGGPHDTENGQFGIIYVQKLPPIARASGWEAEVYSSAHAKKVT